MRRTVLAAAFATLAVLAAPAAQATDLHIEGSAVAVSPDLDAGAGLSLALAEVEPLLAAQLIVRSKLNAVNNLAAGEPVTLRVIDARPLAIAAAIAMGESDNHDGIVRLRTAIDANTALRDDLTRAGYASGVVIGAGFANDGSLILYAAVPAAPATAPAAGSVHQAVLAAL